jgi:TatD DNase family protein
MSTAAKAAVLISMPTFIDSHAHLCDPAFDDDRDAAVERLRGAGGVGVVCIGESIAAAERAARFSAKYPNFVFATAGVHPHDAAEYDIESDPTAIRELVARGAVAIGECGLDYHYDHSPRPLQRRAFASQLELAKELNRPVVVHTRQADDDTAAMVAEAGRAGVRGVLHCFTGPRRVAETALAAGWYVSFSGIVTFKKWDDDDLIRAVPDDRLLVESDSPYLAPVPNRGRRNEPAWVSFTVARVAAVRGAEPDAIAAATRRNTIRLFGLSIPSESES